MKAAVLLLQMGGPEDLDAVEEYIRILFSDRDLVQLPAPLSWVQPWLARRVARRRAPDVRRQYALMGGGSPIGRITREQAAALEAILGGPERVRCHAAMTYTEPSIASALDRALAEGCGRIVALSLFPQYSRSSTGAAFRDLRACLKERGVPAGEVTWIDRWSETDSYRDALAARARAALEEAARSHPAPPHLLVSAHGIPEAYVRRGDPYVGEIRATVAGLRERVPEEVPVTLSFQSRATRARWVQPPTDGTLRRLGAAGVRNLVVLPVSFVSDHLETLYEIDILLAEQARAAGIERFARVPSFNGSADLTRVLAGIVRAAAGVVPGPDPALQAGAAP